MGGSQWGPATCEGDVEKDRRTCDRLDGRVRKAFVHRAGCQLGIVCRYLHNTGTPGFLSYPKIDARGALGSRKEQGGMLRGGRNQRCEGLWNTHNSFLFK